MSYNNQFHTIQLMLLLMNHHRVQLMFNKGTHSHHLHLLVIGNCQLLHTLIRFLPYQDILLLHQTLQQKMLVITIKIHLTDPQQEGPRLQVEEDLQEVAPQEEVDQDHIGRVMKMTTEVETLKEIWELEEDPLVMIHLMIKDL